jgi:hypothetical protein
MNSDAVHRWSRNNPIDDNELGFVLLPQKIPDGMLIYPNADFIIEWNHERNEIPDLLNSHGVTLELWQQWFDRVDSLWIKRIETLAMKDSLSCLMYLFLFAPALSALFYFVTYFFPNGNESSLKKTLQVISNYCLLFSPLISISSSCIYYQKYEHTRHSEISKSEDAIEEAWSDFVSDLNTGKCQQLGLYVKAVRYRLEMTRRYNNFYVSVGLHFTALWKSNIAILDNEGFKGKRKTILTTQANDSFSLSPQNIVNHSFFNTGRNFKVEYMLLFIIFIKL